MEKYAYLLKPLSSFHIGLSGIGGIGLEKTDTIIHSDTLTSAICSLWNNFYDDNVSSFFVEPKFILSSAYHYFENTLFFPKPYFSFFEKDNDITGKIVKNIEYLSESIFKEVITGLKINFLKTKLSENGKYYGDKIGAIFERHTDERTPVNRITNESSIFTIEEMFFNQKAGFYFIAEFIDMEIKDKFETVLRLLGDTGIGADRSYGKGIFEIKEIRKISFPDIANSKHFLTLSLYHPQADEIPTILEDSRYNIVKRQGWIAKRGIDNYRKKSVNFFSEGSIFKKITDKNIYGDSPDLTPDLTLENVNLPHKIFKAGFAFKIPITL